MLKTIGQRIRGVGEDAEAGLTAKLQAMFDQYGINIQIMNEQTGAMASTFDILKAIAEQWDNLTEAQRQNIGEQAAGKNRITEFNALMINFDQTLAATEAAYDSAGITAQQFGIYQESIEGKLEALKLQWQALVAEGGVLNQFVKLLLNAGTVILKLANNDLVKFITKIAAFAGGIALATTAVNKLGVALWSLALNNPAALVISGIAAAMALFINNIETTEEKIQSLTEDINSLNSEIAALEGKDQLTDIEQHRLDLLKEYLDLKEKALADENRKAAEEKFGRTAGASSASVMSVSGSSDEYKVAKDIQADIDAYQKWQSTMQKFNGTYSEYQDLMAEGTQLASQLADDGLTINEITDAGLDIYTEFNGVYGEQLDLINSLIEAHAKEQASESATTTVVEASLSALKARDEEIYTSFSAIQDLVDAENKLRHGMGLTKTEIASLISKYPQLIKYYDAMKKGNISAAEAMHALAVQSFNTSKTVIANSKSEAQATVQRAKATVASALAEINAERARIAAKHAGDEQRIIDNILTESKAWEKYSQAVKDLGDAERTLAFYQQAEYYGGADTSTGGGSYKQENEELKELNDALKEQANLLKEAADLMVSKLDIEISKAEEAKQAIEDENKAVEESNKLAEAAKKLADARAKQSLVYQGGQFVYGGNAQEIAEATKEYNEAMQEYIKNKQIQEIEEHIDALKAEQDTWKNLTKTYEDYLGTQGLGIKQEEDAWLTRIGLAQAYAEEYKKIMIAADGGGNGQATLAQAKQFASSLPQSGAGSNTLTQLIKSGYAPTVSPQDIASAIGNAAIAQDNRNVTVVNNYNVTLPNVSNPTQFVDYFSQKAIQMVV